MAHLLQSLLLPLSLSFVTTAAFNAPAAAHEIAGPHLHPHGDTAGSIALLVAAAAICVWLLRGGFRR